jgi:hypothetical protein
MTFSAERPDFASRLRFRPMQRADVAECMHLLPPWLDLTAAEREQLPRLWQTLAEHPATVCGVQEEMALPTGQRLQGWGATLVMSSDWWQGVAPEGSVDVTRATHATRDAYRALLNGRRLPDEREIGRANAGPGIVFLALHYRQHAADLNDPYALRLLNMANESFRMHHAGYRIQAFFQQAMLADEPWLVGAGFRPRHTPEPGATLAATLLYGLTRDEAQATLPGSSARHVFEHQPPRFRFSHTQRRMLWLALFDDSDDALLAGLAVSVHGLKKLWRGVYVRIAEAEPAFFGDAMGDDDGKRGPEKRRQVLAYVRQRPEELRPWAAG